MLILVLEFMISLSTDHLRAFLAVYEENGFSNAAEKLHLSQSAVSTQVRLFEERIGLTLFDRSKRPPQINRSRPNCLSILAGSWSTRRATWSVISRSFRQAFLEK